MILKIIHIFTGHIWEREHIKIGLARFVRLQCRCGKVLPAKKVGGL